MTQSKNRRGWGVMKYYIRYEQMGGEWFYMIYKKSFFGDLFFERWNTPETAVQRLSELLK